MSADPTITLTPVDGNKPALPPRRTKYQSGTAEGPANYDPTNKWTITVPGLRRIKGHSIKFVGVDTWYPGEVVISGNTLKITVYITATNVEVGDINCSGMTAQVTAWE